MPLLNSPFRVGSYILRDKPWMILGGRVGKDKKGLMPPLDSRFIHLLLRRGGGGDASHQSNAHTTHQPPDWKNREKQGIIGTELAGSTG